MGSAILDRELLVLKFYLSDVLVNACETALNHGLTEGIISESEEHFIDALSTSAGFQQLRYYWVWDNIWSPITNVQKKLDGWV